MSECAHDHVCGHKSVRMSTDRLHPCKECCRAELRDEICSINEFWFYELGKRREWHDRLKVKFERARGFNRERIRHELKLAEESLHNGRYFRDEEIGMAEKKYDDVWGFKGVEFRNASI